ncbi:uncharacterized protein [Dermacentor albipictus]|uniref:uncharacterized protein n=1 Tax=Dermacentor albipictus TaxID=60249 RepID=UPI0031FD2D73
MMSVREFFLCLSIPLLAQSNVLENIVPADIKALRIGENVTLQAYIFYDSAFVEKTKKNSESVGDDSDPMKKYFEDLFRKVELAFHNESVMISVEVEHVSQKNDLSVYYYEGFLNEKATLENVTAYGKSLGQPSNTIFYHFTWSKHKFISTNVKTGAISQSAVETDGTFCSQNTSAAVIGHLHGSMNRESTVKATAFIFGSLHFLWFDEQDKQNMNETFLRCLNKEKIPEDIPAC